MAVPIIPMAIGAAVPIVFLLAGIRIVRPVQRGLVERFGKYNRFATPGFNWVIPPIEHLYRVNITEQMIDAESQEIITKDNLNEQVDAKVYFKVKSMEQEVKNSVYNVNNHKRQIVQLARTTLRNIIGNLTLTESNSDRNAINKELQKTLTEETKSWGIDVVRTELKEIAPPADVQAAMNEVVKAENKKLAAEDYATATETKAKGEKRAAIQEAQGSKEAAILEADGEKKATVTVATGKAEAIKLVNESAEKYFKNAAVDLKKLEVAETVFKDNAKIVVPQDTEIINLIGSMSGVKPVPIRKRIK